jgi:pimeloyl-ACP methyl ester carboxylesterase
MESDYPLLKTIYTGIDKPVLFIGGGEEPAVKYGKVDAMKDVLPNFTKAIVLDGCGHWLQTERTREVNDAIIEFLESVGEG